MHKQSREIAATACAPAAARTFSDDPELLTLIVSLTHIATLFQLSDGLNIVARCVLRVIQDLRFVSVVTIALTWSVTDPLAYLLVLHLGYGAAGVWWSLLVEEILVAAILWTRLLYKARAFRRAASNKGQATSPVSSRP